MKNSQSDTVVATASKYYPYPNAVASYAKQQNSGRSESNECSQRLYNRESLNRYQKTRSAA
jgi:hypothetical protein